MASPMETIKQGLGKVKDVNKAKKSNYMSTLTKGYIPDGDDDVSSEAQQRLGRRQNLKRQGSSQLVPSREAKANDFMSGSKLDQIRYSKPRGILPAVGAASSIADAASEIDNIRKGKSDILERTGIYKRPKEL